MIPLRRRARMTRLESLRVERNQTKRLLAETHADLRRIAAWLRDVPPNPWRWRESNALRAAEVAMARIEAEARE